MTPLSEPSPAAAQYLKCKNNQQNVANNNCKNHANNGNANKNKAFDKKSNKMRARLESESSSDLDNHHKNTMMFEMDM